MMNLLFLQDNFYWIGPLMVLELILKGFALWKSARRGQNIWFIFLLVINSAGILPAVYLLLNQYKKENEN